MIDFFAYPQSAQHGISSQTNTFLSTAIFPKSLLPGDHKIDFRVNKFDFHTRDLNEAQDKREERFYPVIHRLVLRH